jgi:hypothetical protein
VDEDEALRDAVRRWQAGETVAVPATLGARFLEVAKEMTPPVEGEVIDVSPLWEVVQGESTDVRLVLREPQGWYSAQLKLDGCVDFTRFFNVPDGMPDRDEDMGDTLHICDLDDLIDRLRALQEAARRHFGATWPR